MDKTLISYQNVEIGWMGNTILQGVNFEQKEGGFTYIIGKSGSGKSSFLKTICYDLLINAGSACVFDYNLRKIKRKHISFLRKKIGIIFQDFQLLANRSTYDNLKFALKATGWKGKNVINDRIQEVLLQVGIEHKSHKMPHELSEGEQQQIIIARALLNFPKIILADEPTRNLDIKSAYRIVQLLQNISEKGMAVIMATHNCHLIQKFLSKSAKIKKCDNKGFFDYKFKKSEP